METIVFEVRGEYALFKKPYSPTSPVSYPFPPPTAIMGMLSEAFLDEGIRHHGRNIKRRDTVQADCHRIANDMIGKK